MLSKQLLFCRDKCLAMGAALFPASLARRSWFDSQRLLLLGWLVRVSVNIALAHASNTRTSPAVHNKSQLYHGTKNTTPQRKRGSRAPPVPVPAPAIGFKVRSSRLQSIRYHTFKLLPVACDASNNKS